MTTPDIHKNTNYTSSAYQKHANFVPLLTTRLIHLLSPQPTDRIIDIGAGDLVLSSTISTSCAHLFALDASETLLTSGIKNYPPSKYPNISTRVVDCRYLENEEDVVNGTWDKVVSNAALHWILRDPRTRDGVIKAVHRALKTGGMFVVEMGGFGNVAEVHTALVGALYKRGFSIEKIQETSPWYFPTKEAMTALLEGVGFEVKVIETEYRPTELSEGQDGGVLGWLKMFGSKYLELVDEEEREVVAKEVRDVLSLSGIALREDGRWVVGYNRLRFVAQK